MSQKGQTPPTTAVKHAERDLIAAMSEPGFYPERPHSVEFRQTHISCVFLAGESVYKIKKPVRFPFVDYSTLKLRYQFCQEEVRLNRRLTPRVYRGVFPIIRGQQGFALGAEPVEQFEPAAVEYAVKMRRLPDERSLERLVRTKQINDIDMRKIAQVLAKFHAEAARDQSVRYGSPEAVGEVVNRNLEECRGLIGDTISEAEFQRIDRFNRSFIDTNRKLLERRAAGGMVRDGHGDLRSEHVCITGKIDIIDCVEFSEGLRYADIASDLAFLLMDLDRLGAPALGHQLLTTYLEQIADPELPRLLNFYKCSRAAVRAKVSSLKAMQDEVPEPQRRSARETAHKYFALALGYAKAGSPALIVVCGLPASGKSTIAKVLAERSGFPVFNSDVIRKRLAGKAPTSRAGADWRQGIYSQEFTAATYAGLLSEAAAALRSGAGAIIDATYMESGERVMVRDLARQMAVPIVFVECAVGDAEAKARLDARAQQSNAVSDATWEIYLQHKAAFAPFAAEFGDCHLRVEGAADAAEVAWEIERFIANHY
jgi:uncharacterized protein